MSPVPRVWEAEAGEAAVVAGLLGGFRDFLGRERPGNASLLASVTRLLERGDALYLLGARHDDAPPEAVAQVRFRYGVWHEGLDCALEDLFVAEGARGSGLGRAMVEGVLQRALERDCPRIELDTDEDNAAARALYESCGFVTGAGVPGRASLRYRRPAGG